MGAFHSSRGISFDSVANTRLFAGYSSTSAVGQGFTGPNFSVDNVALHFYTDGRWGTHTATATAIGKCI
jgi:hypothetical protein